MKKLIVFLLCGAAFAQTPFNRLRIVPNSAGTAVGEVDFAAKNDGHAVSLAAPDAISADVLFRLPPADGANGDCLTTDGSLNLSFGACGGLTAPATITGNTSSFILQLTQSGSGLGLTTNAGIKAEVGGTSTAYYMASGGTLDSQADNSAFLREGLTVLNGVPKLNGTANGNGVATLALENGALNYYTATSDGSTGTATLTKVFGVSQVGAVTLNTLSMSANGGTTLLVGNTGNPGIAISASAAGVSPAIVATAGTGYAIEGDTTAASCTGTPCAQAGIKGSANTNGIGVLAHGGGSGIALYVDGSSTFTAPATINSTLSVSSAATFDTVSASFIHSNTFQVSSTVSSGNMAAFQTTGAGTAIYASSSAGLAAEFANNVQFDAGATITGTLTANGGVSGTHLQNLGTGDSPTFAAMTFVSSGGTSLTVQNTAATGNPGIGINATTSGISPAIIGNNTGGGIGIQAQAAGTGTALYVSGTSTFTGVATFNANTVFSTLNVTTLQATDETASTLQVAKTTSGNVGYFYNPGTGNGLYAVAGGPGYAAEFGSAVKFDDALTGTHAQNLGAGDSPTFNNLTVNNQLTLGGTNFVLQLTNSLSSAQFNGAVIVNGNMNAASNFWANGQISGAHLQNLGTADRPTFASISVGSCSGCGGTTSPSYSAGTGVSISPTNVISIGQAVGTGNAVTFSSVTSSAFVAPGWNYNTFGGGTWTASAYYVGGTQGHSGNSCSQWTAGLCTAP